MDFPINTALISNPINWIIILLMIVFAMFIMEILLAYAGVTACGCHKSKEA